MPTTVSPRPRSLLTVLAALGLAAASACDAEGEEFTDRDELTDEDQGADASEPLEPASDQLAAEFDPEQAPLALNFYVAGTIPYPVTTTGIGTGMTVGRASNDPHLFFVTQTSFSDPVVVMHLDTGTEILRYDTPPGRDTVGGLAYDWFSDSIWATQGTTHGSTMFEFDPATGVELNAVAVPHAEGNGLAFNGVNLLRADVSALLGAPNTDLDMLSQAGAVVNSGTLTGSRMEGLSIAPLSYLGSDTNNNTVWITTLWFNTYASFTPPGTSSATRAVAYDNIRDYDYISQLPTENGAVGDPGTPYHPDTAWDPAPWGGRHRIYLANEAEQTIYFGYLYL